MKRNHYIAAGIVLALLPLHVQAQTQPKDTTLNRTVVVEQEYTPDIPDASKVNVLPQVETPQVNKKEVEYATTLFPATTLPGQSMQVYAGKEVQPGTLPGYVRAGYGNYGNLDVFGNYLFRPSQRDRLNVNFQMNGMNGKLDVPYSGDKEKWDAYYYRTRASLDYTHQFRKLDLNLAGNFGLSNFNHLPHELKKQKLTSGDIHAGVRSTDETLPLQFAAETNLMLYSRQLNTPGERTDGVDETIIRTKGRVTGMINDEQRINIAFALNNMFYKEGEDLSVFKDRTLLDLTPYYEIKTDNWHLRAGAHVDLSFGAGKSFRASPDVSAEYIFADSYVLYAKATGGRLTNDLRRLEEIDPYALYTNRITDTYEQLNARLGFKASPVSGLWFNLYGGYQNLKDDLFPYAEIGYEDVGSAPSTAERQTSWTDYTSANTENFYAGLQLSYAYKDIFSFSVEGTYYHWDANYPNTEDSLYPYDPLLMKPEIKLGFQAEIRPIPELRLNLGYEYLRRAIEKVPELEQNIPAVNDLSVGIDYRLFKNISIYAQAHNLLNKKYQWYYRYPTEGLNFVGGLSFQF